MPKSDLTGRRFDRLVVLRDVGRTERKLVLWRCRCDCGSLITTNTNYLTTGHKRSCGCLFLKGNNLKHGHARKNACTREFNIWRGMLQRCNNQNNNAYKYYGAKGVKVCKRWYKFENFYADMGKCPAKRSIDRINPYGNYTPRNCRWATQLQQIHNRRRRRRR